MDSKKKMIIAISSFAMVIFATIVAVFAVLAAKQIIVKSSVNIKYTADPNIIGSISASYRTENGTSRSLGTKTYTGSEPGSPSEDFTPVGSINFIKETNDYIEFTFTFTNTSTIADYTADLSFTDGNSGNGALTNMTLSYKTSKDLNYITLSNPDLSAIGSITVSMGRTETYILKVALTDLTKDASFTGTLQWNLYATR